MTVLAAAANAVVSALQGGALDSHTAVVPFWTVLGSSLLALLVAVLFTRSWLIRMKYDLHKIPLAPGAVPILGHIPLYWSSRDFTAWFLKFHDSTNSPVLRVLAPHKRILIVADPAITAQILSRTDPNNVPRKVPEYSVFDDATGLHGHHSILTEQDEDMWVAVRKALSPAYTPAANKENYAAALKAYGDVGRRIAAAIKQQAKAAGLNSSAADGMHAGPGVCGFDAKVQVVQAASADVQLDYHLLAAAIQTQVEGLFGMVDAKINYLQAAHDLEFAIGTVHDYSIQPWKMVLYKYLPWATQHGRKLLEARLRLAHSVYEPIMQHVETCENPSELSLAACLRRLVDPRTGEAPHRHRLLAEVGNQIMAPETAAHTIAWILYCVSTHPAAEAKLLKELRAAGLPCNGDLNGAIAVLSRSFDPLKGLPFLEGVINEAMRMYPAGASASPRLTEKATMVGQYRVPAGVMVFPSLFVVNNYSGSWGADARQFKPERWAAPDAALDPVSGAPRFLPFSAGPKNCIGLALGQVVVRSAVAMLLSTYSFRPAKRMGSHDDAMARSMLALTLKVEGGLWLNARYRSANH